MFKKITAVILCLAMLLALSVMPASSVRYDDGMDALRSQWQKGYGPKVSGFNIDYSYFCPDSQNPCPLMIYMGGMGNGTHDGKELNATDFPYWSSEEFQAAAVNADGMYLMILRSPLPFYFDTCPLRAMFAAIEEFVNTHNVDRKRICLFGRCLGASGVNRLANAYPDFFSGACYFCPRTLITPIHASRMKNMKIWLFCSFLDLYAMYPIFTLPSWLCAKIFTTDKNNIRLTSCVFAPIGGFLPNHEVYHLVEMNWTHDVENDYVGLFTVDGFGNRVKGEALDAIKFFTSGDYTPAGEQGQPVQDETPGVYDPN